MVYERWRHAKTVVYIRDYHLICCHKYRRLVRGGEIEKRLKELIKEKAQEIGVEIVEMEARPDHPDYRSSIEYVFGLPKFSFP